MSSAPTTVSRERRAGFYIAVGVSLALVIFGLAEILFYGLVGWLGPSTIDRFFPGDAVHRFHGLGHSLVAWLLLASVAVQLWRPQRRFAPAVYGLVILSVYTLMDVVSGMFDSLEAVGIATFSVMVWLHPGREMARVRPFRTRAAAFATPLVVGGVVFAVMGLVDQISAPPYDPHAAIGHYGDMAALALSIAIGALIGSTSLTGSPIVAGLTVGASTVIGTASILFPGSSSSPGVLAGTLVIVAAVLYGWSIAASTTYPVVDAEGVTI